MSELLKIYSLEIIHQHHGGFGSDGWVGRVPGLEANALTKMGDL